MVKPMYSQEELDTKINAFLQRKSAKFPRLKLTDKQEQAQSKSNPVFDALNTLAKLLYGTPTSSKQV